VPLGGSARIRCGTLPRAADDWCYYLCCSLKMASGGGGRMDVIRIVNGSDRDLDILAAFNQQLIEDTKHDNGMTVDQLRDRMRTFIHTDYRAYLFMHHQVAIGYALVD